VRKGTKRNHEKKGENRTNAGSVQRHQKGWESAKQSGNRERRRKGNAGGGGERESGKQRAKKSTPPAGGLKGDKTALTNKRGCPQGRRGTGKGGGPKYFLRG